MASTMHLKYGDQSPVLVQTLQDADNLPVDITGATVRLHVMNQKNLNVIDAVITIDDAANGIVSYAFDGTLPVGNYRYEIEVTYADTAIETFPNVGYDLLVISRDLS